MANVKEIWDNYEEEESQNTWEPSYVQETYNIPKFNFGYLMERVDKLNKRAKKMGLDPTRVETIREYDEHIIDNQVGNVKRRDITIRMVEVKVIGKAPKFDGWIFIATIEHDKAASNLIKTIPGIELGHSYRDAQPDCDHCGHMRWRKKTYICRHEERGSEVQVGSTCVKDFLGHRSPEAIAWQCEMLGNIREMFCDMENYDRENVPRSEIRIPTRKFLQLTAAVIHNHGWMSKSKALENPYDSIPTVSLVDEQLFPPTNFKDWITIEPDDVKLAYDTLQWAKNLREIDGVLSDYEYNLNVLAKESSIPISAMGLAVSMVGVFKMKKDKTKNTKVIHSNNHFGEVKKRYELDLKVATISGFDSEWGYTTIYKMVDPQGNAFSWFTTGRTTLEEGETYHVKATVKKHQEYMGRNETVVTRLTVVGN